MARNRVCARSATTRTAALSALAGRLGLRLVPHRLDFFGGDKAILVRVGRSEEAGAPSLNLGLGDGAVAIGVEAIKQARRSGLRKCRGRQEGREPSDCE